MMDYAARAMKNARSAVVLSADMGVDAFLKTVRQIWSQSADEACAGLEDDPGLQRIYRALFNQARDTASDFRWLGRPEVFQSLGAATEDAGEEPEPPAVKFRHLLNPKRLLLLAGPKLLYLLGLAALGWTAFSAWKDGNAPYLLWTGAALALLLAGRAPAAWSSLKRGAQGHGKPPAVRVEQRVDPAAAWNSLEKAARAVDDHAAALYAHFAQREEQALDGVDGLPLAKALADWECQEGGVPDDIRTALRLYLTTHGIEALRYSPERAAAFQLMPGGSGQTIEPALVKKTKTVRDGVLTEEEQLLYRGLACVGQSGKEEQT